MTDSECAVRMEKKGSLELEENLSVELGPESATGFLLSRGTSSPKREISSGDIREDKLNF